MVHKAEDCDWFVFLGSDLKVIYNQQGMLIANINKKRWLADFPAMFMKTRAVSS